MIIVTVDDKLAMKRFSSAGIPEGVRKNLRAVLPDLTKRLGNVVEGKLDTELESRKRLKVDKLLREDPTRIVGQVRTRWTGDQSKNFIPEILERGAKAHPIEAKNAGALSFFWKRMGFQAIFKRVWHPGFPGINFTERSFKEMEPEITKRVTEAVDKGLRGVSI